MSSASGENLGSLLSSMSESDLLAWLRRAVFEREAPPLSVPRTSEFTSFLAHSLSHTNTKLRARIRHALPTLFDEWGVADPQRALDDLLIVCATLRAASARRPIARLARSRLPRTSDFVAVRQRCLSVLSGLGCTKGYVALFKKFLGDPNYCALCYRALYLYKPEYAASVLHTVLRVHAEADMGEQLRGVLRILFTYELEGDELCHVIELILKSLPLDYLRQFLEILREVGVALNPIDPYLRDKAGSDSETIEIERIGEVKSQDLVVSTSRLPDERAQVISRVWNPVVDVEYKRIVEQRDAKEAGEPS